MPSWPDPYNTAAAVIFAVLFFVVPALGYVFLVLDFRAYLRSLRRGLVRVFSPSAGEPSWYRPPIPTCLDAFGLGLQCTEDQLKRAYFERVKVLHPDRGGDQRKFLRLQARFEEALALVRNSPPPPHAGRPAGETVPKGPSRA